VLQRLKLAVPAHGPIVRDVSRKPPAEGRKKAFEPAAGAPRRPPSMDSLLSLPEAAEAEGLFGREAVKEELRRAIGRGATEPADLVGRARAALRSRFAPTLRRAVNATGILLHTNLGRSP